MQKRKIVTNHQISVFKIRIDIIQEHAIGFELFAGDKVKDTYVNVVAKGGYGTQARLLLTPKQFSDFAIRTISYVYLGFSRPLTDNELMILWELRLNIFDVENQQISGSIFDNYREKIKRYSSKKG
jgi:hypothetical protein